MKCSQLGSQRIGELKSKQYVIFQILRYQFAAETWINDIAYMEAEFTNNHEQISFLTSPWEWNESQKISAQNEINESGRFKKSNENIIWL